MNFHKNMSYWVWLQRAAGKGANLKRLLEPFGGDVRALYEAHPSDRERILRRTPSESDGLLPEEASVAALHGGPSSRRFPEGEQLYFSGMQGRLGKSPSKRTRPVAPSTLDRMKKVSLSEAEDVLALCERTGIQPLCPEDEHYPWLLREVPTHPAVLYALGDVRLLSGNSLPFAMVGARDARLSSLSAASDLAGNLSRAGFLIVSGGAIGTDSACHIGALNAGCPTVAVLGTGIGTKYLQQNADLRRVISHNGLLLSEMEPGEPGSRGSFPMRNRIIAGMSVGTLVVEAAVKSGSLITSKYAEEYDRDVFVPLFPGIDPERPISSPSLRGTRELLERETGVGIRCAADILMAYAENYGLNVAELLASEQVSADDLLRDITDLAGVMPPLLSRTMILKARAQLGGRRVDELYDLAGDGTLNPNPGWGPYRTADDATRRTYTSAEFAYRRGDHPYGDTSDGSKQAPTLNSQVANTPIAQVPSAPATQNLDPQLGGAGASASEYATSSPSTPAPAPSAFSPAPSTFSPAPSTPLKPFKDLSSEAKTVLNAFQKADGQPLYYEDIAGRLDMAPQYLLAALTELTLASYIDLTMDQRYVCTVDLPKVWHS